MLPITIFAYRYLITEENETLRAGIYIQGEEQENYKLMLEELMADEFITFSFIETESLLYLMRHEQ